MYEQYFDDYVNSPDRKLKLQYKHFFAVKRSLECRTKALGICVFVCRGCGETKEIRRSCKHRFCGHCGGAATYQWAEKTLRTLMDIPHHHIVTTLPKSLRNLSKMNKDVVHDALFKISAAIIKDWFEENENIQIGIVSVLHTAGSDLKYHPHIHMIVSRGGKNIETGKFINIEGDYLCPQRELGKSLKNRMTEELCKLYREGKLRIYKKLKSEGDFRKWLESGKEKHWIVSIQKPLDDINQIVGYVGRYTKRASLSEYKIKAIQPNIVFEFNDYKNTPRGQAPVKGIISLEPDQFLDKLLQHVPNKNYKIVRYFGLYNSRNKKNIPDSFKLQADKIKTEFPLDYDWGAFENLRKSFLKAGKEDPIFCQNCQETRILAFVYFKNKIISLLDFEDSS